MARRMHARGLASWLTASALIVGAVWWAGRSDDVEAVEPASPNPLRQEAADGGLSVSAGSHALVEQQRPVLAATEPGPGATAAERIEVATPPRLTGPRFSHAKIDLLISLSSAERDLEAALVQVFAFSDSTRILPGRPNSVMATRDAKGHFSADLTELFVGVVSVPETLRVLVEAPSGCSAHRDIVPSVSAADACEPRSIFLSTQVELRCPRRVRGRAIAANSEAPLRVELHAMRSIVADKDLGLTLGFDSNDLLSASSDRTSSHQRTIPVGSTDSWTKSGNGWIQRRAKYDASTNSWVRSTDDEPLDADELFADTSSRKSMTTDSDGIFEFELFEEGEFVLITFRGELELTRLRFRVVGIADVNLGDF